VFEVAFGPQLAADGLVRLIVPSTQSMASVVNRPDVATISTSTRGGFRCRICSRSFVT